MGHNDASAPTRGQWTALTAALLGWMFDGFEIGMFPLVAQPALRDLLDVAPSGKHPEVELWLAVGTAVFLVGAATGGVLFGWLGDRLGRVRAMTLSVLTYAICTGLCGLAANVEQLAVYRFLAALGMGGEWSLGVALVMEVWPDRSRAWLAGIIGAAANVGFLMVGVVGLWVGKNLLTVGDWLGGIGLPGDWVAALVGHAGWRLMMLLGATPALLTFLIRIFVPESARWKQEHGRGATAHWAARDLAGVGIGAAAACGIIYLWAVDFPLTVRWAGTLAGLAIATAGYSYPVIRYLQRANLGQSAETSPWPTLRRMWLGAGLSGVALLGTWGCTQWAPSWAYQLVDPQVVPTARADTQIWSALGAIVGSVVASLLGERLGRRWAYTLLCLSSFASILVLFQLNTHFGWPLLWSVFAAGFCTAAFYGWLPLYLPELFPTRVRSTGQGFGYNFGRILAAVGAMQTSALFAFFDNSYANACSLMSTIYLVGAVLIWFAPETRGQPLPE